jgi:hypothetical protein
MSSSGFSTRPLSSLNYGRIQTDQGHSRSTESRVDQHHSVRSRHAREPVGTLDYFLRALAYAVSVLRDVLVGSHHGSAPAMPENDHRFDAGISAEISHRQLDIQENFIGIIVTDESGF